MRVHNTAVKEHVVDGVEVVSKGSYSLLDFQALSVNREDLVKTNPKVNFETIQPMVKSFELTYNDRLAWERYLKKNRIGD